MAMSFPIAALRPLLLVGTGNLGSTLCTHYSEFEGKGFEIVAAFDNDPNKIGTSLGHIANIQHINNLRGVVNDTQASIVILAIPGEKAQEVTKMCVDAGVSTILNYSPVALRVPEHVHVEYMDPAFKIQMVLNSPINISSHIMTLSDTLSDLLKKPLFSIATILIPFIFYLREMQMKWNNNGYNNRSNRKEVMKREQVSDPPSPLTPSPSSSQSSLFSFKSYLHQNRYDTDFEEIGLLGRGGFGSVFKVLNRIDGMMYAVKKVKISIDPHTVHDISEHKYLREVRAMARMSHPNVVRYCYAWMEPHPPSPSSLPLSSSSLSFSPHLSPYLSPGDLDADSAFDSTIGSTSNYDNEETRSFATPSVSMSGSNVRSRSNSAYTGGDDGFGGSPISPDITNDTTSNNNNTTRSTFINKVERIKALLFIQMELCGGLTLRKWLSRSGRTVHLEECTSILTQILRGLHHIHTHGFIHRDVTPANLFLEIDKSLPPPHISVKIGDFGLAKHSDDLILVSSLKDSDEFVAVSSGDAEKTSGVGTYLYASPEQLSRKSYNNKTDLYSVGVILFEMLSAFQSQTDRIAALTQLKKGLIPHKLSILYPQECGIIQWLMKEEPDMRPSALDVLSQYNVHYV